MTGIVGQKDRGRGNVTVAPRTWGSKCSKSKPKDREVSVAKEDRKNEGLKNEGLKKSGMKETDTKERHLKMDELQS